MCHNLDTDHSPLLELYHAVDALPGIKKSFIGSGVRYDLLLHKSDDEKCDKAARQYTEELVCRHVSGRLKVAPEHTSEGVLRLMRKPSFRLFEEFKKVFDRINRDHNLNQQLIPYFISSRSKESILREVRQVTQMDDFKGREDKTAELPPRTGARLHAYANDRQHGSMVHGPAPVHA